MKKLVGFIAVSIAVVGCGCNGSIKPDHPRQPAPDLIAKLAARNDAARAFRAKTSMDYMIGKDRVKGTVWVQGRRGAFMRFNAINPGSGNVAVDLACTGDGFKYLNYNDNCKLVGQCNKNSIAQLLRVGLAPDDFLLLAVGSTPVLDGTATSTWDSKRGHEVITITAAGGAVQTIRLSTNKGRMDVVESVVVDRDGATEWKLSNKKFSDRKTEDGQTWRVPGKSRFEQPKDKADLIVDWKERSLNLELEDDVFDFQLNMGIPDC